MGTTLLVNPGSTSTKLAVYVDSQESARFTFEDTGSGFDWCIESNNLKGLCQPLSATEYHDPIGYTLKYLLSTGLVKNAEEITAVAVRLVAPGDLFMRHQLIDDQFLVSLKQAERFAPLHIPPVLKISSRVTELLPTAKQLAISDSAFHATVPEYGRVYSVPKADADYFNIKRFGYHGLSVASVASRLESVFGYMPRRTIVAHIGGGMSITGLLDGKSRVTSMGLTPASGLMMGERAGDLDGASLLSLLEGKKFTGIKAHQYINQAGGFRALVGVSDLRLVMKLYHEGNKDAVFALQVWTEQVTKIIGGYITVLGGVDAIVLTATAMVRNAELRQLVTNSLSCFGVELDDNKNAELINREGVIHLDGSKVPIAVLKTDELLEMFSALKKMNQ